MGKTVRYVLVRPAERRVAAAHYKNIYDAERDAGLDRNKVNHGGLENGHSIVVDEHGLMQPLEQQHLFSIGKRLYAGNAVIYAQTAGGSPMDATAPEIRWYKDADEVWQAIQADEIIQPSQISDGEVWWTWPDAQPAGMTK